MSEECFNLFCKNHALLIAEACCYPGSRFPMCKEHLPIRVDFSNVEWQVESLEKRNA